MRGRVNLPEDWSDQIRSLERTEYEAARSAGWSVSVEQRAAFEGGLDAVIELVSVWLAESEKCEGLAVSLDSSDEWCGNCDVHLNVHD
jgi:hypothetical protein